jgi:hypothetical protein
MPPSAMTVSYSLLLERIGHYLFGIRSSFSADQIDDIEDCMRDGLNRVYNVHNWSFFRPVVDLSTTAPYATGTVVIASGIVTLTGGTFPSWAADGLLRIGNRYHSIASRNSNTQVTLDNLTVTESSTIYELARLEITLPDAFDAIANDSDLTYYPDQTSWYPPIAQRHDNTIRKWQQTDPRYERPLFYSIRTVQFDPTIGSRKVLALYPIPDAVYVFRVPMILRPVMLDATNQYPIGGEHLGQLIIEACLAAAEHNFEEREHVHEKRFLEMIPLIVMQDQERSSPSALGLDGSVRYNSQYRDPYQTRQQRIGNVWYEGDVM